MRHRRASLLCPSTFVIAVFAASLLSAGSLSRAPQAEPPGVEDADAEADRQRFETFILGWVDGGTRFEWNELFHQRFSDSPHKADSERYEVAAKCLALHLHDVAGKPAAARITAKLSTMGSEPELDDETARRVVFVLGRLPGSEALDILCRIASGEDETSPLSRARAEAVEALRFFGAQPGEDRFLVFGGRFGTVVLPARPEPRAADVLFDLVERGLADPPDVPEEVQREALDALPYHATPALEERALRLSARLPADSDVIDLLRRTGTPATLARLAQLATEGRGESSRTHAVRALGWSAQRAAIPVLLEALGDATQLVREAADDALHRLAGDEVDPPWRRREPLPETTPAEARAEWRARFGESFERFAPDKARRRDPAPGVYGYPG